MGDKLRVGRHDGRIQKMLYEKVVLPTNNIQHGIHNKHDKQRNGGHGNDTRQNVADYIQHLHHPHTGGY